MVSLLAIAAASLVLSAPPDSNQITNPGFESGTTGWTFWARSADSGRATLAGSACHSGASCLDILHLGSQDWAESNSTGQVAVQPGEVWQFGLWARIDSLPGSASLSFVERDSNQQVLDWNAASATLAGDTGWQRTTTRFGVPEGCASLQARLTGYGHGHLRMDDADFRRVAPVPSPSGPLRLADDSLSLEIDPLDLSMSMKDSLSGDTTRFGAVPGLRVDSARTTPDTLRLFLRLLSNLLPLELDATLRGGAMVLTLRADSATPLATELPFPGVVASKPGQFLAMPRGTGLAIPVDGSLPATWGFRSSEYWEWQVTQGLAGATDGSTGYVISADQPWDTRQYIDSYGETLLSTRIFHEPAKGVWAHDRSLQVAPIRGGGWAEMARRHRSRLEQLGRVRTWSQKISANPATDRLRGAVDFWIEGSWSHVPAYFDTLRLMGLDKAVVDWTGTTAEVDTMVAHGWLSSIYDDWSDAWPAPKDGSWSSEYPSGAVVQADGSYLNGWLEHTSSGDVQALEICSAHHPAMARQTLSTERQTTVRNARFVDVELAITPADCFSSEHPQNLAQDAASRLAALSVVEDTFHVVTGSEQHRDWATAHVDWGEGSMSIATVDDAGYDWVTPEVPNAHMDSLSMTPSIRVPLLPLATHDAFAPTWYTGDGQSKVPLRWDEKDVWNALYSTMPLLMPSGRSMWDSLRVRYLRTANLLGALHLRTGFEPMTNFVDLSADGKVQRTTFANGWTVTANFDAITRSEAGYPIPSMGFVAMGAGERIERSVLDSATRSRVRLSDRWFLDPEGTMATVDGIRTNGAVFLRPQGDTAMLVSFVGDQDHVDILASGLPWPATGLSAQILGTSTSVPLADVGSSWVRLAKVGSDRFYLLKGSFGPITALKRGRRAANGLEVVRFGPGWDCLWTQDAPVQARVDVVDASGRILFSRVVAGRPGSNRLSIPASGGPAWVRLRTDSGTEVAAVPMVR